MGRLPRTPPQTSAGIRTNLDLHGFPVDRPGRSLDTRRTQMIHGQKSIAASRNLHQRSVATDQMPKLAPNHPVGNRVIAGNPVQPVHRNIDAGVVDWQSMLHEMHDTLQDRPSFMRMIRP